MSLNWVDLVRLEGSRLAALDLALVNLACAVGLPGSDEIDVDFCLSSLDEWAERVR